MARKARLVSVVGVLVVTSLVATAPVGAAEDGVGSLPHPVAGSAGAAGEEPERLTTRAGGSVEVEVPSAPGSTVTVTIRRTDGDAFGGEAHVAVESAAGSADLVNVPVQGSRTLTATARLNGRGETSRVRVGFDRRGDYSVTTSARRGLRQVETREYPVEVSSYFDQVASIPVNTEIVHATSDGARMVSTANGGIAVVDIRDLAAVPPPVVVPTSASVTAVALTPDDRHVLVADFDGVLSVVDLTLPTPAEVREIGVPAGADAVAVSPDGRYAAVAIESGLVVIVDLVGDPADWTLRTVQIPLDDPVFSGEGAIENVDISPANKIAAASQTTGAVAVIDAPSGAVDAVFSLGESERLYDVDGYDHGVVFDTIASYGRLPDAVVWTPDGHLVTANENGGARSFSVFTATGEAVFDSGAELERQAAYAGTWNPGDPEFEGADVATFGSGEDAETFAFVGAERWSSITIYRVDPATDPRFVQMAPVNSTRRDSRPEGIDAIPSRGLVLVANEDENTITVLQRYESLAEDPTPTVGSAAVAWQELYGLDTVDEDSLVAVGQLDSTGIASLYRMSRTATELRVDGQVDLSSLTNEAVGRLAVDGVAHDPKGGGAWLAVTPNDLTPYLVRVDRDGHLGDPLALRFGGENRSILGIDTDRKGEVVYALIRWRSVATRTFFHEIVEYRVSNGSQRRWLYQPSATWWN